jgi:hypothetical protein
MMMLDLVSRTARSFPEPSKDDETTDSSFCQEGCPGKVQLSTYLRMMMLDLVSRTARSFPEPAIRRTLLVTSSRTTPRGAATYPAKMMRPLAVARLLKAIKNPPKNVPYSAKYLTSSSQNKLK